MRVTGLSAVASLLILGSVAAIAAATEPTPFSVLANFATYLSQNAATDAMALFDPQIPGYGEIYRNIEAITAQTDPSCAIELISDQETAGVHKLDIDVVLQLKSKADPGRIERRRERVQLEMKQIKGNWKITAFAPLSILDPIHMG